MSESRISYGQFLAGYTQVVARGAEAWRSSDPITQVGGVDNALRVLEAADAQYRQYVDRAALLGPELGGTVIPNPTLYGERVA